MDLELRSVLESMAVGVFVVDAGGVPVLVNAAALHMLGISSVDELQSRVKDFHIRAEDGSAMSPECMAIPRVLAGEIVVQVVEVINDGQHGNIMLRTRTTPICDHNGMIVGAVKVMVDVSREYELANVRDEFIRQAAHELKTPIAAIMASAERVSAGLEPSPSLGAHGSARRRALRGGDRRYQLPRQALQRGCAIHPRTKPPLAVRGHLNAGVRISVTAA